MSGNAGGSRMKEAGKDFSLQDFFDEILLEFQCEEEFTAADEQTLRSFASNPTVRRFLGSMLMESRLASTQLLGVNFLDPIQARNATVMQGTVQGYVKFIEAFYDLAYVDDLDEAMADGKEEDDAA